MLRARLNDSLKTAMRAKDQKAISTLRLILAALKDRDIAARSRGQTDGIGDEEIIDMMQKMIRQRRDSVALYEQGGRDDLAQREKEEIEVIQGFLPQQMDPAESQTAIEQAIADVGATSVKDMGRVMAALKERYAGRLDFAKAGAVVKERLK